MAYIDPETLVKQGTYAIPLPEHLNDPQWSVYRHVRAIHGLVSRYPKPDHGLATIHDVWQNSVTRYADQPALGWRDAVSDTEFGPYRWMTYGEAGKARDQFMSGLLGLGIRPGDTVGLYSANCKEWVLSDAACHAASLTTVPLYDTLGPDAVRYICGHAELSAVVVSAKVLPIVLQCVADAPTLRAIVVFGASPAAPLPPAPRQGLRIVAWDEVLRVGRESPRHFVPPAADQVATICYTSGTTGVPKGAVLTHANMIANSAGNCAYFPVGPGDVHVSYLPLAHIYERVNQITLIYRGVGIGFFTGDVLRLLDDIAALRPTIFTSVPRLLNRIYDKVMGSIAQGSAVSRALFNAAYAAKSAVIMEGRSLDGPMIRFYDAVVFSKVRARLGGRVRLLVSGASPISREVFLFLRAVFPVVLEGYGMTESACVISLTDPGDRSMGHVGAPIPAVEIKLVDIPDMNYLSSDRPHPRGEVCVRGPCIFKGYHKDPVQSAEAVDEGGWLHTGDVGEWLPGGRLKIIDRKKNLFKLAQGEYIAPEKIEAVYCRSPLVMQCFAYGDSLRGELVGVVVPDPEAAADWARRRGKANHTVPALLEDPAFVSDVLASMKEEARNAELRGFEQVASVTLVAEPMSVENGLLTPTFKLKRPEAKKRYAADIERMYAKLG